MKSYKCYRIVEVDEEGNYKTLFHGINGSRKLPLNTWIVATKKFVTDGDARTATEYLSGFHVLKSMIECEKYLAKFTKPRNLQIIELRARGQRQKLHSPYEVYLADEIFIKG